VTVALGLLALACIALGALLYQRTSERNTAYAAIRDLHTAAQTERQQAAAQLETVRADLADAVAVLATTARRAEQAEDALAAMRHAEADRLAQVRQAEALAAQRAADLRQLADYVDDVIRQACRSVGLNDAQYRRDLDLVPTGKLADVLYHVSQQLTAAHPVRTVADVIRLFVGDGQWAS